MWAKETSRVQAGQVWKDDALRCRVTGNSLVEPEDGTARLGVRTTQAVTAPNTWARLHISAAGCALGTRLPSRYFFPPEEASWGNPVAFPHPFPGGRCVLTDWGTGMSKRATSFLSEGRPAFLRLERKACLLLGLVIGRLLLASDANTANVGSRSYSGCF